MDETIASALVDRLLHHAHVIVTEGESRASPTRSTARG
jgi:DNA replication protein DnaC